MTDAQRAQVIVEAKTWLGTPYRGHSHLKGCGADCGQLLYAIYRACGLVPVIELPKDYSLQVAKHRASTEYVDIIKTHCDQITEAEAKPGDIVVYKLGFGFSHGALIVQWPEYVIQAEAVHGVAGAHGTKSPVFRRAPREFYTPKAPLEFYTPPKGTL